MKPLISLFFALVAFSGFSQKSPNDLLDTFFDRFDKSPDKAIEYIFSTNSYIKKNQKGIERIKERLNTSRKLLGEYYGKEIIKIESVGDSYIKYDYMLRYDRQPVKLEIVLYRPDKKWLLYTLQFDDNINDDFRKVNKSDK